MGTPIFLETVTLSNYRSIRECCVSLGPLTFLVGPNGAGKSNFLDALRLVAESLNTSLEHALRERGGINEVRRRSSGHPTHFGIRLEWRLPDKRYGFYAFRVAAKIKAGFEVQHEECHIYSDHHAFEHTFYQVESGRLQNSSFSVGPPVSDDRLYLVSASGLPEFRALYDAFSHMGFYNLNPEAIRELQPPDPGGVLKRDGSNLASVLSVMAKENKDLRDRVVLFLSKVSPGIQEIDILHVGKKETLEFRQSVGTNTSPWRFPAENMSDGTLRALGVLTALFQSSDGGSGRVPFVGIEEPEAALHPGAAGILRDALFAASVFTQVAVTSHSPDLLDDKDVPDTSILAVANKNGETVIAPPDRAGRESIRDRLYTAGELLRLNLFQPDEEIAESSASKQTLFAEYKHV